MAIKSTYFDEHASVASNEYYAIRYLRLGKGETVMSFNELISRFHPNSIITLHHQREKVSNENLFYTDMYAGMYARTYINTDGAYEWLKAKRTITEEEIERFLPLLNDIAGHNKYRITRAKDRIKIPDDLESLGWIKESTDIYEITDRAVYSLFILPLRGNDLYVRISEIPDKKGIHKPASFTGWIKNKRELKEVMKLLNVFSTFTYKK